MSINESVKIKDVSSKNMLHPMACLMSRISYRSYIQGCIQKFQDSTCKKKFAYLGC